MSDHKRNPYNFVSIKRHKIPLKRSLSGFEFEHHVLDSDGYVAPRGADIMKATHKKYPKVSITKEPGKNQIELCSFPAVRIRDTALKLVDSYIKVAEVAKKLDLVIYPYATYPGKFKSELYQTPYYKSVNE